jgi:hypothetical protein
MTCCTTRQLEKPRGRWEGNTKMALKEIRRDVCVCQWLYVTQGKVIWRSDVNVAVNLWSL